jgi:hypothetical protein
VVVVDVVVDVVVTVVLVVVVEVELLVSVVPMLGVLLVRDEDEMSILLILFSFFISEAISG